MAALAHAVAEFMLEVLNSRYNGIIRMTRGTNWNMAIYKSKFSAFSAPFPFKTIIWMEEK